MIKRRLFTELKAHLFKKEISFIVGPRQAGKTFLMLLLKDYLEKQGKKTLFLNLDFEHDKEFFTSQVKLVKKIELELGKNQGFVFIDEIQRKDDAGLFLKGIYDMRLPYKFVVSGSGSVELREKIHESLVGRKRVFELSTVSFEEFINFKTRYKYEHSFSDFFTVESNTGIMLLEEYLDFGGYPRLVIETELAEKRKLINEIYQSYIERDIAYLLKVHKTEAFSNLVRMMAAQIGRLTNYSELSSTLGISMSTVKQYLWYLEKTYILKKISPYYKSMRKEITKSPVFYFYDLGLRNFAAGVYGTKKTMGFIFQNFVFNLLKEITKTSSTRICFWRTKDKAEVDFVIDAGEYLIPIEVKYKKFSRIEISRALRSFLERYKPQKALIVNLSLDTVIELNRTRVHIIPFHKIIDTIT